MTEKGEVEKEMKSVKSEMNNLLLTDKLRIEARNLAEKRYLHPSEQDVNFILMCMCAGCEILSSHLKTGL
jgi:hypothetical protein